MKIDGVFEKIIAYKKYYQPPKGEKEATKQIEINKRIKEKFLKIAQEGEEKIKFFRINQGIFKKGFRCRTGIPKRGYENLPRFRRWFNEKALNNILTERFFSKKERDLFLRYKNNGPNELTDLKRKELSKIRRKAKKVFIGRFRYSLLKLAGEIKMDIAWFTQFEEFVLFNIEQTHKIENSGILIKKKLVKIDNKTVVGGKLILEIGPNTRLKDIKSVWMPKIDPILKDLHGYIYLPTNRKK